MKKPLILVTGGAGYIGSHTALSLMQADYPLVIVDNFSNSKAESLRRIEKLSGKKPIFYQLDICDYRALKKVFAAHPIAAVIHFAGYKAVGESVEKPLEYYRNNVYGSTVLLECMRKAEVRTIIFSSSATVYRTSTDVPFTEDTATSATNPYGWTKLFIEQILLDLCASDSSWKAVLLRYFNPVGAHSSGEIGEDPRGIPNNLMPFISQVAAGRLKELQVFGNDYPTADGTGIRDYIHVMDLAEGHVKVLEAAVNQQGASIYNLGTGRGHSVLEVVHAFEKNNGISIPYKIVGRRAGDIAESYADVHKAEKFLKWKATRTLDDMVRDAWNWQKKNPEGYA